MKKLYILIAGSFLFALLAILPSYVKALSPSNGVGVYTNLCGTGTAATVDSCNKGCNTEKGTCSGTAVAKFVCDGRQNECGGNKGATPIKPEEWGISSSIDVVGCGQTVQLDVYTEKCRLDNGNWKEGCQPVDYMVWYSGDCSAPPPPPPQAPACDPSQVKMSVSPNPAKVGDLIIFTVSGLQGSTWIGDSWSGGVNCSGSFWGSKTCAATASGNNFGWTHTWQNTAENNFDIKSPVCSRTINFSIQGTPPPPPPPCTPNDSCSVSIPSACGQTATGVDNCRNVCSRSSAACQPQGGQSQSQSQSQTQTVNITNPAPVIQTFGNVGVGTSGRVLGVKELPKTGLPALIWSALALIPTGFGLRKFRSLKKVLADNPNFIWEERQFKTGS